LEEKQNEYVNDSFQIIDNVERLVNCSQTYALRPN